MESRAGSPAVNRPGSHIPVIVSFNIGSTSVKFSIHQICSGSPKDVGSGTIEKKQRESTFSFDYVDKQRAAIHNRPLGVSVPEAVGRLAAEEGVLSAIGHRLVHGGPWVRDHLELRPSVIALLKKAVPLAPLHLPPALDLIDECIKAFPEVPQVGCLDTTFHQHLPAAAATLPLPKAMRDLGIRRYGFHGLSCESIVHQLHAKAVRRLVVAHLGGGSSVTAIENGHSVDTSLALTPMGGVVMSRRSGDLDPGILLYLLREKHYDPAELEDALGHNAGLSGLTATNGDLREVQAAADSGDADASLALEIYARSTAKQIAGAIVVLGGVDRLVFTGGVGEHASGVVDRIREQVSPLIGTAAIHVMPSFENERIAFHTMTITDGSRN